MTTLPVDSNIRLALEIPERVPAGSIIPITMRLENTGTEAVELYLRGREMTCDFVVTAPGGAIVWRRLEAEVVPAILRLEVLRPGQTMELRESWNQVGNSGEPVAPGAYFLVGALLTEGSSMLESAAVALRIDRK